MLDFDSHFRGKKITVMGLGLLGRGVGDAAFLAECGAEVIVTDLKTQEQLKESVAQLKDFKNVTFVLGEHRLEDFDPLAGIDFVLAAAGVPIDSKFLQHARDAGIPLKQSATLFAELSKIPIIGVTGTRGKSTVTQLIHHTLSFVTGEPIILGGNVRGVSNLQLLKEVQEDSLAVMELDSWQLQGFGWAEISPQVSVFTNFMDDHLNYYKNDRDAYFADKAQIFLRQEESGTLVTTPEVFERAKTYASGKGVTLGQEVRLVDSSMLPEDCLLAMPGEHNRLNAALALEALRAVGLQDEEIYEGFASFPGVPGRLEYLREVDGVKIYNDNNATTPTATIAALKALGTEKNIILVCGGSDKELPLEELVSVVEKCCKRIVLYSGTGTEKFKEVLSGAVSSEEHEMLSDCVAAARGAAATGDIILFSPAFSSFGKYYKNEYDRNDQFVDLVQKLWV